MENKSDIILDNKIEIEISGGILVSYLNNGILDLKKSVYFLNTYRVDIDLNENFLIEVIREILKKDIPLKIKAKGKSMFPFIRKSQDLIVISAKKSFLDIGSIVVFIHPQNKKLIIHRIIKKKYNYFLTKGDAAFKPDGWITKNDILGVVCIKERYKNIKVFLNKYKILYLMLKIINLLPKKLKNILRLFNILRQK